MPRVIQQAEGAGEFEAEFDGFRAGGAFVKDGGGLKFLRERHDADFARPEHHGKAREGFEVERSRLRRLDGEVRGHEGVVERLVVRVGQLADDIGRDEQLVNAAEPGEQRLKVPALGMSPRLSQPQSWRSVGRVRSASRSAAVVGN